MILFDLIVLYQITKADFDDQARLLLGEPNSMFHCCNFVLIHAYVDKILKLNHVYLMVIIMSFALIL